MLPIYANYVVKLDIDIEQNTLCIHLQIYQEAIKSYVDHLLICSETGNDETSKYLEFKMIIPKTKIVLSIIRLL